MDTKKFQKRKEDFVCGKCGTHVIGDGYTNHCPHCLWSKHVDINPGDRAATCRGLMEPISIEGSTGKGYVIRQKCLTCGHERLNRVSSHDSTDAVVELAHKGKRV